MKTSLLNFFLLLLISISGYSQQKTLSILSDATANCQRKDGTSQHPGGDNKPGEIQCEKACDSSKVNYFVNPKPGRTYIWYVTGDISHVSTATNVLVNWGAIGIGTVSLVETDILGHKDSIAICIEIIKSPKALFSTLPPDLGGVVNVCRNQALNFTDHSINAVSWFWDFGDGNTFSGQSPPSHPYPNSGTYTVSLIVHNACNCADTMTMQIEVDSKPGPAIDCPSVVCEGDTAVYSTKAICNPYSWSVTGGTIISSPLNSNTLVVVWGSGATGPGTVTLDVSGCPGFCTVPTTITIPIIPKVGKIIGDTIVCLNSVDAYTLPNIPGTQYNWVVVSGGFLNSANGGHEISVFWNTPGTHIIKVNYYNQLLDCGGSAIMKVNVFNDFLISGPTKLCENHINPQFLALSNFVPVTVNWSVLTPLNNYHNNIQTGSAIFNNYTWNEGPGIYTVTAIATHGLFCNDTAVFLVNVLASPPMPGITGTNLICPGSNYLYSAVSTLNNTSFQWIVQNGTMNPPSGNGNVVNVTWNPTGPYSIGVFQQYNTGPACSSDTFYYPINKLPNPVITGPDTSCINGTAAYSASLYPGLTYNWAISPAGLGSVISGNGTNNIQVQWNNAVGSASLSISYPECPVISSVKNIILKNAPAPIITSSGPLCSGGAPITLSATSASSYAWTNATNVSFGGNNQTVSISTGGNYNLTVVYPNLCSAIGSINITENPSPTASISSPFVLSYCNTPVPNITLYALVGPGYSYQWYLNGLPISGETNSSLVTNITGAYNVIVTLGICSKISNTLTIIHTANCGTGGCSTLEFVSFNAIAPICNPVNVNGIISAGIGSYGWNFGDPTSGSNSSSLLNPSHTFTQAGFYNVTFSGNGISTSPPDSCAAVYIKTIEVPIVALFKSAKYCLNDTIQFTDLSTHTPGNAITSWSWNFGDLMSVNNTSILQNPTHIFSSAGNFTVQLTISNGTCTTNYTSIITIYNNQPIVSYIPNPVCVNQPVTFNATGTLLTSWLWNFGDATGSTLASPSKTYTAAGTYTFSVNVINALGCKGSYTNTLTVKPSPIIGPITPSGPISFCLGLSQNLMAPSGSAYLWSTGVTTPSINVNTSGNYYVQVADINGCHATTPNVVVAVLPSPQVDITGITDLCKGAQLSLSTINIGGYTYQWSFNGIPIPLATTSNYTIFSTDFINTGTYVVMVTDAASGCSKADTVKVKIHPYPVPPTITPNAVGPYCSGTTYTFSVSSPDPTLTYIWSTGVQGASITTNQSGNIFVQAINTFGCATNSNIFIIYPLPDVASVMSGCYEFCDSLIPRVIPGLPGYASYNWLKYDSTSSSLVVVATTQNLTVNQSGSYQLVLTNYGGCSDTSDFINITFVPCNNCEKTKVSVSPATNENDCCWNLDIANLGAGNIYSAIGIHALNANLNFTLNDSTWNVQNIYANSFTLKPTGSYIPIGTTNDLLTICLKDQLDSVQQVVVSWYGSAPKFEVLCTDTLVFNCKPDVPCVEVIKDSIYCVGDSLYYSFYIFNDSEMEMSMIELVQDSLSGIMINPAMLHFPMLQPDSIAGPFVVQLSGAGIIPGKDFCFTISAHNAMNEDSSTYCCNNGKKYCIKIPPLCNPCDSLTVSVKGNKYNCCYAVKVKNHTYLNLVGLQTVVIGEGYFNGIDNPLGSDWNITYHSPKDLLWTNNVNGYLPVDFNLPQLCFGGSKNQHYVVAFNWLIAGENGKTVLCSDTLVFDCMKDCMAITKDTVYCKEDGTAVFNFSIMNQFHLPITSFEITDITGSGSFTGSTHFVGTIPTNGTGTYSIGITGNPGDRICFRIHAFEGNNTQFSCCKTDSIYCIVIPKCCKKGIIGSTIICKGQIAKLCLETCCNDKSKIKWSTGAKTDCITINTGGTYTVQWVCNNVIFKDTLVVKSIPIPVCGIKVSPESGVTGGIANVIYKGYGANCLTLSSTVTAFSYLWSTGATTASITVCPETTTTYTLTVTNKEGCKTLCEVKICVFDIRCPQDTTLIYMCKKQSEKCVKPADVPSLLSQNWVLGQCGHIPCDPTISRVSVMSERLVVFPNPIKGKTTVEFTIPESSKTTFNIYDINGKLVATVFDDMVDGEQTLSFDFDSVILTNNLYVGQLKTENGYCRNIKLIVIK